jgi:hypothetical protein
MSIVTGVKAKLGTATTLLNRSSDHDSSFIKGLEML